MDDNLNRKSCYHSTMIPDILGTVFLFSNKCFSFDNVGTETAEDVHGSTREVSAVGS